MSKACFKKKKKADGIVCAVSVSGVSEEMKITFCN